MKVNKTIGVLGGMGPQASSSLYAGIIRYAQQRYGAVQDFDYPPVIISSLQLFGFNETGIVDADLVKRQLIEGVLKLESAGCELIVIACNTVHVFYDELQAAVCVPIFNIVEETKKRCFRRGLKRWDCLFPKVPIGWGFIRKILRVQGLKLLCPHRINSKF